MDFTNGDDYWQFGFALNASQLLGSPTVSGKLGGGVFDSAGNLIGIHKGIVSAGAGRQFNSARVELFRANWKTLTELATVDEIDADKIAGVVELLKGLKAALAIDGPGE